MEDSILKLFSAIHHFELSVQVFRVFQFQGILKILASLSRLEWRHGLVGSSSCVNTPWAHLPAVIWFFSLFLLIHSAPLSPNSIFHSSQRFPPRLAHPFPVVQFESAFASHFLFLFRVLVDSHQYAILYLINIAVVEPSWSSSYCSSSTHFNQILCILPRILMSSLICLSCAFFICFITHLLKILISVTSLCVLLMLCSDAFSPLCLPHVVHHISYLMMFVSSLKYRHLTCFCHTASHKLQC